MFQPATGVSSDYAICTQQQLLDVLKRVTASFVDAFQRRMRGFLFDAYCLMKRR